MEHVRVAYVTVPRDKAKALAQSIVEERLGACVNIIPAIESIYWWQGKINHDNESLLMIKTTRYKVEELITFVKENHPYDVPEIITFELKEGLPDYIDYVIEETDKKE